MPTKKLEKQKSEGVILAMSTPGTPIPSGKRVITLCTRSVEITMPTQGSRRIAPEHRETANFWERIMLLNATVSKVTGETLMQGIQLET